MLFNRYKDKSPKLTQKIASSIKLFSFRYQFWSSGEVVHLHKQVKQGCLLLVSKLLTLARTDLLYMLNWGTQRTMVSYLKK